MLARMAVTTKTNGPKIAAVGVSLLTAYSLSRGATQMHETGIFSENFVPHAPNTEKTPKPKQG